jgi:hypothetical protein
VVRYVTGAIEVGSAILLLVPPFAVLGALLLACTMVGAVVAHVTVLHSPPTGPVAVMVLCGGILWIRGEFSLRARGETSVNTSHGVRRSTIGRAGAWRR